MKSKSFKNNKEEKKKEVLHYNSNSFSLEQLNRIGNNDRMFTISMLEKFINSASECSETMIYALSINDWNKIKIAAHKSIPSYSLMGLTSLVKDLVYIENYSGLSQHDSEIRELVKTVEVKNNEIIYEIRNCINDLKQNGNN